jgi:DNA-directed RNA polymerase II subunit RPB4
MSRFVQNQVEMDSASPSFGDELKGSHCLLHSEVQILLEACQREREREESANVNLPPPTPVFLKCHQYAATFGRWQNREIIRELRQSMLQRMTPITEFEMVQMANLCPESVDEARLLIPSTSRIDDMELQAMIDDIQTSLQYQA